MRLSAYLMTCIVFLGCLSGCVNIYPAESGTVDANKKVVFVMGMGESPQDPRLGLRRIGDNLDGVRCIYISYLGDVVKTVHDYGQEDVVFVGYSAGGEAVVNAITNDATAKVHKLILIEPVATDIFVNGFVMPDNVERADCYLRHAAYPPFSKAIVGGKNYENHWRNWGHDTFTDQAEIEQVIREAAK